jgi:hypothetical protein
MCITALDRKGEEAHHRQRCRIILFEKGAIFVVVGKVSLLSQLRFSPLEGGRPYIRKETLIRAMDKLNGSLPVSLKKDDGVRSAPMTRRGMSVAGAYMGCAGTKKLSLSYH